MSDLAAALDVPLSTATRTADKLVAKGLVDRRRSTEDRRIIEVAFSQEGRNIHRYVVESRLATARKMFRRVKATERTALIGILDRLISNSAVSD